MTPSDLGIKMSPSEAQEEFEEVNAELKKRDEELTESTAAGVSIRIRFDFLFQGCSACSAFIGNENLVSVIQSSLTCSCVVHLSEIDGC